MPSPPGLKPQGTDRSFVGILQAGRAEEGSSLGPWHSPTFSLPCQKGSGGQPSCTSTKNPNPDSQDPQGCPFSLQHGGRTSLSF